MEFKIYGQNGLHLILDKSEFEDENFFKKEDKRVGNEIIKVGEKTKFCEMFPIPVFYKGILEHKGSNVMCFYVGSDIRIDGEYYFFSCFYYINENRIANQYKQGTVRDFNFINNKWK
jgi:hypothetical protein